MVYDIEKEKREAIDAGQRALKSLYNAKTYLEKAKSWGFMDIFGGGLLSTMAKHSNMNNAKECMLQAKYDLQSFSRELNDVNIACNLNIETSDFLAFADLFFDGFVADWLVQGRINKANSQVKEAINKTEHILRQLRRM